MAPQKKKQGGKTMMRNLILFREIRVKHDKVKIVGPAGIQCYYIRIDI